MRISRTALVPLAIVGGLLVWAAPTVSGEGARERSGLVDFRMAPLEQAKKINQQVRERHASGETLTVMAWDRIGDGQHLILKLKPKAMDQAFGNGIDSVSWHRPPEDPSGSCDSNEECEAKTREMCEGAGHGDVNDATVTVTLHADGSQTCSADCTSNGAVALVTCNP